MTFHRCFDCHLITGTVVSSNPLHGYDEHVCLFCSQGYKISNREYRL